MELNARQRKKIVLTEYYEEQNIDGKLVKVITRRMAKDAARLIFPYRPHSKHGESLFGGDERGDDDALMTSKKARQCKLCGAPTQKRFLYGGICPDCEILENLKGIVFYRPQKRRKNK